VIGAKSRIVHHKARYSESHDEVKKAGEHEFLYRVPAASEGIGNNVNKRPLSTGIAKEAVPSIQMQKGSMAALPARGFSASAASLTVYLCCALLFG